MYATIGTVTASPESAPTPLAWSLGQGLLVGAIRAVIVALAMGAAFAWIGWPVAGAALAVAVTGVEAWARRREQSPRTILLAAAWAALLGAFAVGWGFLQGIYATQLWRSGSPEEARAAVVVAYRGIYDPERRKDALWKEVLPWLERHREGDPRTPLIVLAAASALLLAARLARHRPFAFRGGPYLRAALSPVALPLLGILVTLVPSHFLLNERLLWLLVQLWGVQPREHAAAQAALALTFLAGALLPLSAALADLAARRPRGEAPGTRPGPWSARLLLAALVVVWLGFVTIPARAWPTSREEALAGVAGGDPLGRAGAMADLAKLELDPADLEVREVACRGTEDESPLVREKAFLLLRRLADLRELEPRIRAGVLDDDPAVHRAAARLLVALPRERALEIVRAALGSTVAGIRCRGLALAQDFCLRPELLERVLAAFDDPDPDVRRTALGAGWTIGYEPRFFASARRLLSDPHSGVRSAALEVISFRANDLAEVPGIERALGSTDPTERAAALDAVANLVDTDDEEVTIPLILRELERDLEGGSATLPAAQALRNAGPAAASAVPALRALLQRPLSPVQREVIQDAIAALGQ